jgi:alcohol dehydrogenase
MTVATRGAVLEEMGHPIGDPRGLHIADLMLDSPQRSEVLVAVAHASLCHSDLSVLNGDRPRPTPMVLGHEASGVVQAIGDGVTEFARGDRVVFTYVGACGTCRPCRDGKPALCMHGNRANAAGELFGGGRRLRRARGGTSLHHHLGISAFADHAVVDQASLVKLPDDIDLRDAALFGCAVLTGAGAVLNSVVPIAGRSAVVFCCGGVGLAAVLGLRALGAAPIIAVDRGAAQLQLAAALGADIVLEADDGVVDQILTHTNGGVDLAYDASAAIPAIENACAACASGAQLTLLGLPHPDQRWSLSPSGLVARDLTVRGSYMGSSVPKRDIPRLVKLFQRGRLSVERLIYRTIRLDEIATGMVELANGVPGRIVVDLT